MDSFYQYVDQDILPTEYGGLQDKTSYLNLIYSKNVDITKSFKHTRADFLRRILQDKETKKR